MTGAINRRDVLKTAVAGAGSRAAAHAGAGAKLPAPAWLFVGGGFSSRPAPVVRSIAAFL